MKENPDQSLQELEPVIKTVEIIEGNIKLTGRVFLPPKLEQENPAALLIHGWKSSQGTNKELAQFLSKKGYVSLTFNLRGHGDREGKPDEGTRGDYLKDVEAAYDCLIKQEQVDPNNITVIGSSFGGYLASLLSEKRKIKNLVLRVPADYKDEGFDQPGIKGDEDPKVMEWRREEHDFNETASLRALHKFEGSVLIVESWDDDQIPRQTIANYVQAAGNQNAVTFKVMEDAPHSITRSPELKREFEAITGEWLDKNKED